MFSPMRVTCPSQPQVLTANNYNTIPNFHTLHAKSSPGYSVFTSRCSVTDLKVKVLQLLCSRRYCPANIPQLNSQLNYSAISFQPPLQNSTLNWLGQSQSQSQSQSQGYFTTGALQPISSSWRQAPWDSRPVILFSDWTLAVIVNWLIAATVLVIAPLQESSRNIVSNSTCILWTLPSNGRC
jgi:hypothetical protein